MDNLNLLGKYYYNDLLSEKYIKQDGDPEIIEFKQSGLYIDDERYFINNAPEKYIKFAGPYRLIFKKSTIQLENTGQGNRVIGIFKKKDNDE